MIATAEQRVAARWIPKGAREIRHALGVCYIEDTENSVRKIPVFRVCAFIGTAQKAARHTFERLDSFVDAIVGKRLTYKQLIGVPA